VNHLRKIFFLPQSIHVGILSFNFIVNFRVDKFLDK